jgi:hypothetical protein
MPGPGTRTLVALCGGVAVSASAQSIVASAPLSFGTFIAGSGGGVTVSASGSRSATGGVFLLGQGNGASAGQFTVLGTPNATVSITLPTNNVVVLTDGNSNTMFVNSFVSMPGPTATLSGGGNQTVRVGATLVVGSNQAPGVYSGTFAVTVNY